MGHDINKVTETQSPQFTLAAQSLYMVSPIIIQTIFDLGADVNLMDSFGNNALFSLLAHTCRSKHGRAILKIILYQNPYLNYQLSEKYSLKAVQCDKVW